MCVCRRVRVVRQHAQGQVDASIHTARRTLTKTTPTVAPASCATMYIAARMAVIFRVSRKANVTAGFRCLRVEQAWLGHIWQALVRTRQLSIHAQVRRLG